MTDKELIENLGGPAAVAKMLGYEKHGGIERVSNWVRRGIPPKVKLEHPNIFLSIVSTGVSKSIPDVNMAKNPE